MVVNGTMNVKVDVRPSEAISIIKDYLGLTNIDKYTDVVVLDKNDNMNECGRKAIYKITDMSWYGSYSDRYEVLTSDENKIAILEAFQLLEETISKGEKLFFNE